MNLTDEKLYALCKRYGSNAKFWRQKFMGLLPEVFKRKLYESKGFGSIFEFAAKLAGVSQEQVRRVLNIEREFKDKPILHQLLVEGSVSIHKLARVVSVATKENQEIIAQQVQLLPQRALETLVRDERKSGARESEQELKSLNLEMSEQNGLFDGIFEHKSVRAHGFESKILFETQAKTANKIKQLELKFSEEVTRQLLELQQKGIDINELILDMLKKREREIAEGKEEIAKKIIKIGPVSETGSSQEKFIARYAKENPKNSQKKPSRYIPVKIRKLLQKEHGSKCSISICKKRATTIHHTQRFGLASVHDPHYLAPLCSDHHVIAHSIDLKFQEIRQRVVW